MNLRETLRAFPRWIVGPRGLSAIAVAILFVVMTASFVGIPWGLGDSSEIPVTHVPGGPTSVTDALFGGYAILVLLSALVLAACMIGGVYLAKTEGGPPP